MCNAEQIVKISYRTRAQTYTIIKLDFELDFHKQLSSLYRRTILQVR